jgi:hypothetical protein
MYFVNKNCRIIAMYKVGTFAFSILSIHTYVLSKKQKYEKITHTTRMATGQ